MLIVLAVFFGLDFTKADPLTPIVFLAVGSLSFIGIGMMAAILPLMYVERGAQMTFVFQSVLLLVSGVYYSIEVLPQWMQVLAHLSPATYVLEAMRQGLIYGTPVSGLLHLLWPLVIMAAVFIPLGIWTFGKAEAYAKRTGKLKRVG
jgi:ABC-2 type transport system permease protein